MIALPLGLAAMPAAAEGVVRAVLVGVGDYLVLDADLKGPPADAVLMAETLMARGVGAGDMTLLTSGAVPAGVTQAPPVKAEIMAALDAVAAASAPGDTVVFYFSGHGSQAPDQNGDEGGGYDEILLPADASGWKGAIGAVENAIVDDELSDWARPMLARGVRLVGIIDACHSATGFRSAGVDVAGVARWVPPAKLGLPDAGMAGDSAGALSDPLTGDFVFLYSSQSDQRSFEYPVGREGVWHGEFTLRLADTLTHAPKASWRQVLAATTEAMAQGPARQQPDAEGPLLDQPVFGTGRVRGRFRVDGALVQAGLLNGLADGAEMALYAAAAGGEVLGHARLSAVQARSASLSGAVEGAVWAEVSAPAPPQTLRLGAPVVLDDADYRGWLAALPPAGAEGAAGLPDLVPVLVGGALALTLGDGVLDPEGPGSTPRVEPAGGETQADALVRVLADAAHALRLRAALTGGSGKARTLTARPVLGLEMTRRAAGADCEDLAPATAFDGLAGPCDQIFVTIKNSSGKVQDVTVLYLSKDFKISPIWPANGTSNRLAVGETARTGLQITPDSTASLEEIWVIAVAADDTGPRSDLSVLASPGQSRATGLGNGVAWLQQQLADDTTTRGFAMRPPPFVMLRQTVRIVPGAFEKD